jgi:hypothetical protein
MQFRGVSLIVRSQRHAPIIGAPHRCQERQHSKGSPVRLNRRSSSSALAEATRFSELFAGRQWKPAGQRLLQRWVSGRCCFYIGGGISACTITVFRRPRHRNFCLTVRTNQVSGQVPICRLLQAKVARVLRLLASHSRLLPSIAALNEERWLNPDPRLASRQSSHCLRGCSPWW